MGASASTKTDCSDNVLEHYYRRHGLKGDFTFKVGGSGVVSGGYSSLEGYGEAIISKAKEQLIRDIAKDLADVMNIPKSAGPIENMSISELLKTLRHYVPNPRDQKTVKAVTDIQKKVCRKLALSINNRYGFNVIDIDADPTDICTKTAEVMYSLFTGLHSEFLHVSADVSRIINNLRVLQEIVDSANAKVMEKLSKEEDGISTEAENIKQVYDKVSNEIHRQMTILSNLTSSVIGPLGKSLVSIVEENKDFVGLTADLESVLGTSQFGDKLGYLLTGVMDVAASAHLVDKALKAIGMSVAEYKNVGNLDELRTSIYKKIVEKSPSSAKDMRKLLEAADILYRNDLSHEDIVEYLSSKKGGFSPDFAEMVSDGMYKDDKNTPFNGRTQAYRKSLSHQLRQDQQLKKQLLQSFNVQVKSSYDKLKFELTKLAKKIGTEIKPSPSLELFVKNLEAFAMSQPDRQNLHIALSGYKKDMNSNFVKYSFMENLINLHSILENLVAEDPIFKSLRNIISEIIREVDVFNDTFSKTTNEYPSVTMKTHVKGAAEKADNLELDDDVELNFDGSGDEEPEPEPVMDDKEGGNWISSSMNDLQQTVGGATDSDFQHFQTIKKSIREVLYYYRISNIKANINNSASYYSENVANYDNIIGEESGRIIDTIQKKYNYLIGQIEPGSTFALSEAKLNYFHNYDINNNNNLAFNNTSLSAEIKAINLTNEYVDGYKFLLEYIRSAKIDMLEAAQALDLYMSKFTKTIQLEPDAVKDFLQLLEQIEVVAKWFTDKSGDYLTGVFESFSGILEIPAGNNIQHKANSLYSQIDSNAAASITDTHLNAQNDLTGSYNIKDEHYYNTDGIKTAKIGSPLKPRFMTKSQAVEFVKGIENSIKHMRALENIIATFSKVNISVSNEIKTFMSSGMMFRAFMKYCVASVISVGFWYIDDSAPLVLINENEDSKGPAATDSSRVFHKMGVCLRMNYDMVKLDNKKFVYLVDPLKVADIHADYKGDICDKIFEMSVKAMVSKVFVVVGTYSLFNKPYHNKYNNAAMSSSSIRQILGGGLNVPSKIIPEAVELYVRLPLLVEFYRKVFEFDDKAVVDEMKNHSDSQYDPIVTFFPDTDSIWGDICRLIFLDAKNIDDGSYASSHVHRMIKSINDIYEYYNSKERKSCQDILNMFVDEVNRSYGMAMREEIKSYYDVRSNVTDTEQEYPDDNRVDYDLVPETGLGRNPAPSDKFRSISGKSRSKQGAIHNLYDVVARFRRSVEANLVLDDNIHPENENAMISGSANMSLSGIISQIKEKVDNTQDEEKKYSLIYDTLHGVDKYSDLDKHKLLMFHETVLAPLTVLFYTYVLINEWNKFCVSIAMPSDFNNSFYSEDNINAWQPGEKILMSFSQTLVGIAAAGDLAKESAISTILYNNDKFKGTNNPHKQTNVADLLLDSIYNFESAKQYFTNDDNNIITVEQCPLLASGYLSNKANGLDLKILDNKAVVAGEVTDATIVDPKQRKELRQRLTYDVEKVMSTLMNYLVTIGTDLNGLTDVHFVGTSSKNRYPVLNYDELEKTCRFIFESVKQSLRQLRKNIPQSIIQSVEHGNHEITGIDYKTKLSLFYLEEHLFNRLFDNKYGNGLSDGNTCMKDIWKILTKEYSFSIINDNTFLGNGGGAAPSLDNVAVGVNIVDNTVGAATKTTSGILQSEHKYNSYDHTFSRLVYWCKNPRDIKNSLACTFGMRNILGNRETEYFPSRYAPIFRSGHGIMNPKSKEEAKHITDKIISETLETKHINYVDGDKAPLLENKLNPGAPSITNVIYGTKGIYTLDDSYDNEHNYINELSPNYHYPDMENPLRFSCISLSILNGLNDVIDAARNAANGNAAYNMILNFAINFANNAGIANAAAVVANAVVVARNAFYAAANAGAGAGAAIAAARNAANGAIANAGVAVVIAAAGAGDAIAANAAANANAVVDAAIAVVAAAFNNADKYKSMFTNIQSRLGLIPKFNQLLYRYVSLFTESNNDKIYSGLIKPFCDKHNSKEIYQGKNINDFVFMSVGDTIYTEYKDVAFSFQEIKVEKTIYKQYSNATNINLNWTQREFVELFSGIRARVQRQQNYTDINGLLAGVCLQDPQEGAVLFASLANALKTIVSSKNSKTSENVPAYLEESLVNVSEYQKELMRTYLPVFEKELNILIKKADLIKKTLDETSIKVHRLYYSTNTTDEKGAKNATIEDDMLYHNKDVLSYTQKNMPISGDEKYNNNSFRKAYLINQLTELQASIYSLLSCVVETQKELSDVPLYFEIYKDSISDYNNRHNSLPYMPISHTTHLFNLSNNETTDGKGSIKYNLLVSAPRLSNVGSDVFKFSYGTRGLLSFKQKASLDYAPSVQALYTDFHKKLGGAKTIDKSLYEDLAINQIVLTRWVVDNIYHKEITGNHDFKSLLLKTSSYKQSRMLKSQNAGDRFNNFTFQSGLNEFKDLHVVSASNFWKKSSNIVNSLDVERRDTIYNRFASVFKGLLNKQNLISQLDRRDFRIYNILDMNIMPINVHALQREVPFSNLMNYSYTFDQMIKDTFGVHLKSKPAYDIPVNYNSMRPAVEDNGYPNLVLVEYTNSYNFPEDTLTRILLAPQGFRRIHEFFNGVFSIMAGATSLSLERPKYISDQLWNKVLLCSLYANTDNPENLNESVISKHRLGGRFITDNPATVIDDTDNNDPLLVGVESVYDTRNNAMSEITHYVLKYAIKQNDLPGISIKTAKKNPVGVAAADMDGQDSLSVSLVGYLRYNTRLVRWLEWFVHIQRAMRFLMRKQLDFISDPVVREHNAISESVTEYDKNNLFSIEDFE